MTADSQNITVNRHGVEDTIKFNQTEVAPIEVYLPEEPLFIPDSPATDASDEVEFPNRRRSDEYAIDRIVDHRQVEGGEDGALEFWIKWYGFSWSKNTWQPINHLRKSQF